MDDIYDVSRSLTITGEYYIVGILISSLHTRERTEKYVTRNNGLLVVTVHYSMRNKAPIRRTFTVLVAQRMKSYSRRATLLPRLNG